MRSGMSHEARQVPSWLIFDVRHESFGVREMKSMNAQRRCVLLFLVSPAVAFAHGTEMGGLVLGSFGAIMLVAIAAAILPIRVGRTNAFVMSAIWTLLLLWILIFA